MNRHPSRWSTALRNRLMRVFSLIAVTSLLFSATGLASAQTPTPPPPMGSGTDASTGTTHQGMIMPADREAAADRAKAARAAAGIAPQAASAAVMNPGGTPDYFGTTPNYANSPQALYDIGVAITGGGGIGATALATVSGGVVTDVVVTTPGTGYTSAPTVTFTGGGATGAAAATAKVNLATGVVTGVSITSQGFGYTSAPTVAFTGGGGSGAAATAYVAPAGSVSDIAVTFGGINYTSVPTVTITSSSGNASATATAAIDASGAVSGITITSPGSGYGLLTDATGKTIGLRKFVDTLPGLGSTAANDLGQYIPIAKPDTTSYVGGGSTPAADYYEIALVQYTEQLHKDLPPTTLRGYVQLETAVTKGNHVQLFYPSGLPILNQGANVYAVDKPSYLGPMVMATRDRPVRIKFTNYLPTGSGGDLFIPTDTTLMGAGAGPQGEVTGIVVSNPGANYTSAPTVAITGGGGGSGATAVAYLLNGKVNSIVITNPGSNYTAAPAVTLSGGGGAGAVASAKYVGAVGANYTENRATLHLHGGNTPWISDGTPDQWTTPVGDTSAGAAAYPKGVSVQDVPDMPDPGAGSLTFYYTNAQSARLLFYHDHAYGITRLNVYAGEAAGYLISDSVESTLVNGGTINYTTAAGAAANVTVAAGTIPSTQIPLIIQDKTFVDATKLATQDPTWKWGSTPGTPHTGDLWFPHVYMPNQNPADMMGANGVGRWDYGPWFWPPYTGLVYGPVANPLYVKGTAEGPVNPGIPNPSNVPEGYMDTPLINGTAYPTMTVQPQAYRLRILNAANDRFWNLSFFQAKSNNPMWDASGKLLDPNAGEVNMVPAAPGMGLPADWPTDGRDGGVPDPAAAGPAMIQIGNESGFLANAVVINPTPIGYEYNRRNIVVLNVNKHALFLGPAERADVIVDFSKYAGKTLILYNDSPAPVPAFDPRNDYYTNDPDNTDTGGAPSTLPGYGPNTRTIMQIVVSPAAAGTTPAAYPVAAIQTALPAAFAADQHAPIVPQEGYDAAYQATYPNDNTAYVRIQDTQMNYFNGSLSGFNVLSGGSGYTSAPTVAITGGGGTGATATAQISGLATLTLLTGGADYASAPTVKFTGGGGSGASAVATVANGLVSTLTLTNPGTGYTSAPTVSFVGGGPTTPATASVSFSPGQVVGVLLGNHGTGYSSAPTVTLTGGGGTGASVEAIGVSIQLGSKAIQELFTPDYGRMNATLGVELPNTSATIQTTIPLGYMDPPTEILTPGLASAQIGTAADGTQIWKITHNGVDTHAIHFHMFDVQLLNRVGWDGMVTPPEPNEIGWKDTVRMNPLEDAIVALRPIIAPVPFQLPNSLRAMDVTSKLGSTMGFFGVDPNNNPVTVTNQVVNYGWEYVWHCHLLGHEENDMMRPMAAAVQPVAPTNLTSTLTKTGNTYRVVLSWKSIALNATGYTVQRSNDAGVTWSDVTTVSPTTLSYTDVNVPTGSIYQYQVVASNTVGSVGLGYPNVTVTSAASNVVTISLSVPSAPAAPTVAVSGTNIVVSWPAFTGATRISVRRATAAQPTRWTTLTTTLAGTALSYTDTRTTAGTFYIYQIQVTNTFGASPWSVSSAQIKR
jgi:FtsP/CotA-like multicopper oxidase with cupredoxin domain